MPKKKKAESAEATHDKRELAQKCLDVAGVIFLALNADQTVGLINKEGCQVLESSEEEIVGKNWFDCFIPDEGREEVRQVYRKLMAGETDGVEHFENSVLTRSGRERLIAWHNTLLTDKSGRVTGTLSSGEDITQRKESEEALRSREAELQAIVDTAVDGIITIDDRGIIRSFNSAASRLFGYRSEEVIGRSVNRLIPEPDRKQHRKYIRDYLTTQEPKIIGIGREVFARRSDGTSFPIYLAVSEMRLGDKVLFTGIVHDLTDFKKMQEQVLQAQHLAAIGEMAATVAHEIKNPLAAISGAIQILRETLEEDDSRHGVMGEVLDQVQRLNNTVRDLLMFSKPWQPSKRTCDLRDLVQQISKTAQEQHPFEKIRFSFGGDRDVNARVDPSLFEQVVWNLLHNSAQATTGPGQISFFFTRKPDAAQIEIIDTGSGIPPDLQERLFRPFFTTKAHGTGLGLAICKKIMDGHNGTIEISSQPGKGTVAILQFPREKAERSGLRRGA